MFRQPPHRAPDVHCVSLPTETVCQVVSEADSATLKQLRLSCKWLADEAAKYLFAVAKIEWRSKSMERLIERSKIPLVAAATRTLIMTDEGRLPDTISQRFQNTIDREGEKLMLCSKDVALISYSR